MSDDKKDSTEDKPEQLTDEELNDVVGAGKFAQARVTKAISVDALVNNDTLFAGPGVVGETVFAGRGNTLTTPGVKGIDKLKR